MVTYHDAGGKGVDLVRFSTETGGKLLTFWLQVFASGPCG
jgi:hypothetical protein